jgi:hypothetical protein
LVQRGKGKELKENYLENKVPLASASRRRFISAGGIATEE